MVKATHIFLGAREVGEPDRERPGNSATQQQTLHLRMHDHGCAALNSFQLYDISRYYWCDIPGKSRRFYRQLQLSDQSLHASEYAI